MKRHALLLLLAGLVLGLIGCDRGDEQPAMTQIPQPPTVAPTEALELPTPLAPTSVAGTATTPALPTAAPSAEPPTAEPTTAPTDEPTAEPPTAEPPTEEPATAAPTVAADASPTAAPTAEATTAPTAAPPAGGELFAPGQVDGSTLAIGGATTYLVQGRRFQPLILFVEPVHPLDVAVAAYAGDVGGQTTPGVTPVAAADNALAGRPEILVLSPDVDGLFTLIVRATSGEGNYTAHLFDLTTPASGVAIQQADSLAAGTEKVYSVTSNGARPVIAVADPTDQSDIALDVIGSDGALLTTANYGGAGGAETAYVLPLGTTSYSIKIREVNGAASSYQIVVITLE